ncbi:3-keto-5-aminohexanoate cleavage protein [Halogeometricum rufum]|uniref:3-keto-5-aminohexanoate cleavage protein n=1 Tax=Halogeometricum rufum TaxID=553469 RepID=UPI00373FD1E8
MRWATYHTGRRSTRSGSVGTDSRWNHVDRYVGSGLEDDVYYRCGELAASNAPLVERVARLAETWGRPVASTSQARDVLGSS